MANIEKRFNETIKFLEEFNETMKLIEKYPVKPLKIVSFSRPYEIQKLY